ncbi:MAG: dicarboxylate/amino acid:cation symporter [Parachlamydiales bacterium]|nr:dicarboxylate/amino acid:cation symporter [Verrucomicrobiota bacterium]MBX3718920.1 dicarboxylate/amino acid:cation symporter [Candidatus Acheromyda pituitae]
MFRHMPFILIGIILFAGIFSPMLPTACKASLYAVSLSLKDMIIFVLPLIIFGLLFKTAVQLARKATGTILLIFGGVCCSNFLSTWISYSVGRVAYQMDLSMVVPNKENLLVPTWLFPLPKWIGNDHAMLSGLILGLGFALFAPQAARSISTFLEKMVGLILKGILFAIPFFILGFVLKLSHEGTLVQLLQDYAGILAVVAGTIFTYIAVLYFAANKFNVRASIKSIGNMLPAALTGLGSMSSAAAMPLTILGAEKNARDPDIARSIIPATVNIHMIGDSLAIPIFAFAVMKNFGVAEPSVLAYLQFSLYFVVAKFSAAAVPGGGILVMLPILESKMGFDPGMLSLITALHILFDPVITCANVLGNGAFAQIIDRLQARKKTVSL